MANKQKTIPSPSNELMNSLEKEKAQLVYGQRLSYIQRKFVMLFDNDNYHFCAMKLGRAEATLKKWIQEPKIIKAIENRDMVENSDTIMDRQERKEMWSEIARSDLEYTKDRIKASELLGKSECDFSEKRVLEHVGEAATVIINTGIDRAPDQPVVVLDSDGIEEVPEIQEHETVTPVLPESIEDLF